MPTQLMYCRMQMQKKGISGFNESATWYLPTPVFLVVVPNYPNAYNHYQKFNPGLFYLSLLTSNETHGLKAS